VDRNGAWKLFDLNMQPNLTGPGRPGREEQDSLVAIAAGAIGWSYVDLLKNLLEQAWPVGERDRD
jgi:D-alanine-D-alanine ligase